jgi:CubicO group peptidase (beta-lactamase class C family)
MDLLGRYVRARMRAWGVPGVAVAITAPGGMDVVAGFGTASVEDRSRVSGTTLFQVGSITKTVTATAIMRLREQSVLNLDVPIRNYLRTFELADPGAARTVTLRHLLTHTAGWEGDLPGDFGRGDDALANLVRSMSGLRQLTPPGSTWSYNNVGFCLAGRVVEAVTREPFETAVRRLVVAPLGLEHSFLFPEDALGRHVAAGHVVGPSGARVAHPWAGTRAGAPAGGLITTAEDLRRFLRFHLGAETSLMRRVLRLKSIREMQRPQAMIGDNEDAVGLSWLLEDVAGEHVLLHSGDTVIHQSLVALVPRRRFALAVLSNAHTGAALCRDVLEWALFHYLDLRHHPQEFVPVVRSRLPEYAGTYRSPLWDFHVTPYGNGLKVRVKRRAYLHPVEPRPPVAPPMRLSFVAQDAVVASDGTTRGTRGEFLRDAAGTIVWFRFYGRLAGRRPAPTRAHRR